MNRVTRITMMAQDGGRRASETWQQINRQPSWLVKTTAAVFFLVVALPILLLVLLAIAVASVLFFVLAATNILLVRVRGLLSRPESDGRENVRVIRRDDVAR